jgi:hypothetical protein
VLAFRKAECVAEERALGFTHSHNDARSWDAFDKLAPTEGAGEGEGEGEGAAQQQGQQQGQQQQQA